MDILINMAAYSPYDNATRYNGFVDIMSQSTPLQIPAYQRKPTDNSTFYAEAVQGTFKPTKLSNLFFSCNNIDVLQDGLRYRVYKDSGNKYIIGRQSDQDMKVIMRSIYLQYGRNLDTDVVGQVRELNGRVLDWAVPEVLSNVKQYDKYKKDISTLPVPLEHSTLMTKKGTKVLEIKSFVWINMDLSKANLFKGTIAVMVIYGVFVLLMVGAGFISDKFKTMVFDEGFAFTVTLLSGIVLVVVLLMVQVIGAKVTEVTPIQVDNMQCPDFWELMKTDQEVLSKINNATARELSKFQCVAPMSGSATRLDTGINTSTISTNSSVESQKLKSVAGIYNTNTMSNDTTQGLLTCDRIYPDYMAFMDQKEFPNEPNKIRCEYVKHCGNNDSVTGQGNNARTITWSGVCPSA